MQSSSNKSQNSNRKWKPHSLISNSKQRIFSHKAVYRNLGVDLEIPSFNRSHPAVILPTSIFVISVNRADESQNVHLWYLLPFLQKSLKLLAICRWRVTSLPDVAIQDVPKILSGLKMVNRQMSAQPSWQSDKTKFDIGPQWTDVTLHTNGFLVSHDILDTMEYAVVCFSLAFAQR